MKDKRTGPVVEVKSDDTRCGCCSGCNATPPRPCREWVVAACAKLQRELENPAMVKAILGSDPKVKRGEPWCPSCRRGTCGLHKGGK